MNTIYLTLMIYAMAAAFGMLVAGIVLLLKKATAPKDKTTNS
jgi:hypothetical protein